jgi:hypothetical protein
MAMINIKKGTLVFVPWRIQGIVRNEERQLKSSIRLLEKQNKYVLKCITRNQNTATNKLVKFTEKLNNTPRVSAIMSKARQTREQSKVTATNKRLVFTNISKIQKRLPPILSEKQQTAPKQSSQRIGFLPQSPRELERKIPAWSRSIAALKKPHWPTLATLKRASSSAT